MAFTTFNVEPSDISAVVTNLTINDASSPTTTQVQAAISGSAAEVAAEAVASGFDPSGLATDTAAYVLLQRAVVMKTAADVLVARNRGQGDAGAYYQAQFERIMGTLRQYPQRVQANDQTGPDLAKYIPQQTASDLEGIAWYSSITGKVFTGGL
jgi:hypothetical protein